jgi:hypothetical protein
MKKLVLAAMMAVSCTFAFADSNPVQSPDWRVYIDGGRIAAIFDDGDYCNLNFVIANPFGTENETPHTGSIRICSGF